MFFRSRTSTVVTEATSTTAYHNENQPQAVQSVVISEHIKNATNPSSSVSVCTTQLISETSTDSFQAFHQPTSAHVVREPPHKPVDPGHGAQHYDYADTRDV
ncbi:hypothetical protein MKW94_030427 [Papaver nudicaule]|uniref:Uncharacterized protein n=1 Tax=Papaver nudicaule TaxID=74823 RepID=A0AA41S473_PAPNU|nr:hypothetical protein [Papaver nudicaule]